MDKAFIFYRNLKPPQNPEEYKLFFYSTQMTDDILREDEASWIINSKELRSLNLEKFISSGPRVEWVNRCIKDLSEYLQKPIRPIRLSKLEERESQNVHFHMDLPWGETTINQDKLKRLGVTITRTNPPPVPISTFSRYHEEMKKIEFKPPTAPQTNLQKQMHERIESFKARIGNYPKNRTRIPSQYTSNLSPYLAVGVRSFEQILGYFRDFKDTEYYRQLLWIGYCKMKGALIPYWKDREKYLHRGIQEHEEAETNIAKWVKGGNDPLLKPWIESQMKNLHEGELLSNRSRLILSAYLIRDLKIPWQLGEICFRILLKDSHPQVNQYNWYAQSKNRFLRNYNIRRQIALFNK